MSQANHRENNFNLIRVVAASGVIVSHAYPLALGAGTPEPFAEILKGENLGRVCVFIFFVTSGYFIAQSFERRHSLLDYIIARLLRIYPALIVMLCLMLPFVGFLTNASDAFWRDIPMIIANRLAMFMKVGVEEGGYTLFDGNPMNTFNGSLWTLRFEILCYAGVVVMGYLGVLGRKYTALAVLFLSVLAYYVVPMLTGIWLLQMLSYTAVPFTFGAVAYIWRNHLVLRFWGVVALLLLAALLQPTFLFFPAMITAITYATLWLGYRGLPQLYGYNRFGDYSYGIYIYAFPIQQLTVYFGVRDPVMQMIVSLPITLIFAVLSWYCVEKPALALRTKFRAAARQSQPA